MRNSPQKEGRLALAVNSLTKNQLKSCRQAAGVFGVPETTLRRRLQGVPQQQGSRSKNRLLQEYEEERLINWVLSLERRGFPPYIIDIKRMAQTLLARRGPNGATRIVGVNWAYTFLKGHPDLKTRLSRRRDAQRVKQEDPRIIRPWFERVLATKQKYGILDEDTYNFDETGFAMGLITGSSSKVVGSRDSVGRAVVIQPGNRMWTTVIECVNATGWTIPPFVILEGKVHLDYWYKQHYSIPLDWHVGVSDNGWTTDALGFRWIQHFNEFTKQRTVGTYRLLILDGHGSHATPEFDTFCTENKIITECMPAHTSHILQPLDVACFSPLKNAYGHLVQDLARYAIFHVDKADFLTMYMQARGTTFSEQNITSGFRAAGLIPWNPEYVLEQLPDPTPPSSSHGLPVLSSWTSETPRNVEQLTQQIQLIQTSLDRSSQSPTEPLAKVVKGCQLAMTGAILLEQENKELRASLVRLQEKSNVHVLKFNVEVFCLSRRLNSLLYNAIMLYRTTFQGGVPATSTASSHMQRLSRTRTQY